MFVGAINTGVRNFLASISPALTGVDAVIGCSGNFTSETVLTKYARCATINSNDVSLYSCLAGAHLSHQKIKLGIAESDFDWLAPYLKRTDTALAAVMVLLDMLPFEKRRNTHQIRMWETYRRDFHGLVAATVSKIKETEIQVDTFFPGDVFDHFKRFANNKNAVFMCYAPTYASGYERLYKRLHEVIVWDEPTYNLLDDAARNNLLEWMAKRSYVWYDDRLIPGLPRVMEGRIYSGLNDNILKVLDQANVIRLDEQKLLFEEVFILFVPPEPARLEELVKKLHASGKRRWVAAHAEFDPFFGALLKFKDAEGIVNTATAFIQIAEIVEEYLARKARRGKRAEDAERDKEKDE